MRRSLTISLAAVVVVAIGALIATLVSGNSPRLGLDLEGGVSVVLAPDHSVPTGVLDQAIAIIRNRVDALGVAEPDITRQGQNIVVQLPGVKNPDQVVQTIGTTAELYFRPVLGTQPYNTAAPTTTTTVAGATTTTVAGATTTTVAGATTTAPAPTTTAPATTTSAAAGATTTVPGSTTSTTAPSGCATPPGGDDPAKQVVIPAKDHTQCYVLGPTYTDSSGQQLTGRALSGADAVIDPQTGQWQVSFTLNGAGSKLFDEMAAANFQKAVAIDLDGEVESAPQINAQSFGGKGQITGSFTSGQAKNLALVLRYGSLPVKLVQQDRSTVSATLGKDSLRAGLIAGIAGLLLVLLYMIFYYRGLGIVVLLGLSLSAMLLYSIITFLGQTNGLALSLAGATGVIVSVGVTVDSYVVYFERLKDEIRSGKTVRSSVDRGFSRAYRTILAADLVSLIAAVLLYLLTVGAVRGFAFFLGLSTLLDIVTAYVFTRPMVILLGRNRFFTEARWFGVARGLAAESGGAK